MNKLTKKQRTRLYKVTDELYSFADLKESKEKMIKFEAPPNSLVVAPHTMSKKDFQFFVVRWMDLMEEQILKYKAKLKKNHKRKK